MRSAASGGIFQPPPKGVRGDGDARILDHTVEDEAHDLRAPDLVPAISAISNVHDCVAIK